MAQPSGPPQVSKIGNSAQYSALITIVLIVLAGGAWLADPGSRAAAAVLGGVLTGMIVVDAVSAKRNLQRVSVWVASPRDGTVMVPITFRLRFDNVGRPVRLVQPGAPSVSAYVIDRDGWNELTLPPAPRGIVRFIYVDLVGRGYFGLVERSRRQRCWFATALPIAPPAAGHLLPWPALHASVLGEANSTIRGDDLFRSVREYRAGDSQRCVHWPASAHHGQLMVKERDGHGSYRLRIIVNTPQPGPGAEVALARARWLAQEALGRGWSVQLLTMEMLWGPPMPPPLIKSTGVVPRTPIAFGPVMVVDSLVDRNTLLDRLARASYGPIPKPERGPLTRVISPAGDLWL